MTCGSSERQQTASLDVGLWICWRDVCGDAFLLHPPLLPKLPTLACLLHVALSS